MPTKKFSTLEYLRPYYTAKNRDKLKYSLENEAGVLKMSIQGKDEIHKLMGDVIVYINPVTYRIIQTEYGYGSHWQYLPKINIGFLKYSIEKQWAINTYQSEGEIYLLLQ